ncbi:MAG: hypothetical protein R8L07_13145 [Alphaproteobacteria bacterium]|nr:hypothetical protein [Alphaproteobacteria bacterium]
MASLVWIGGIFGNQSAWADQPSQPATVLFISSWDPHLKWAKEVETGLFARLEETDTPMRLRFEFLGANQHRGGEQAGAFARFLEQRYGKPRPT